LQASAPIAQLVPIARDCLFVPQSQRAIPTHKAKRRFTEFIPILVWEPPPPFRLCQPSRQGGFIRIDGPVCLLVQNSTSVPKILVYLSNH